MLTFGAVSWDYKAVPDEFQRRLSYTGAQWTDIGRNFSSHGHVLLTTCHRVEFYFTFDDSRMNVDSVRSVYPGAMISGEAVRHLFRVASGLESASLGENEILSQVKEAYEKAGMAGTADKLISLIFRKAISVGKTIRERTEISRGKTSIPVLAVDMASDIIDPRSRDICIEGTGQMSETFIKYILERAPRKITLVGRNRLRGAELAQMYGCDSVSLDELETVINSSDLVFSATSSGSTLIKREMLHEDHRARAFVDISNPGNVDPTISDLPDVRVISLKDIEKLSSLNSYYKREEIPKAEEILEEEMDRFSVKLKEFQAEESLTESYTFAESVALAEIKKMLREIDKGVDRNDATRKSASALVTKILSKYTAMLKRAAIEGDTDLISKLRSIFE